MVAICQRGIAVNEHRIPAIDRAVAILDRLAQADGLLTIRELAERTALARSTVYRTLNTLEAHGLARREGERGYALGARLLTLARAVPRGVDIVAQARPALDKLAARLGTSAKLSIVDGDEALVVAVAERPGAYSVTTQVGRRFPLHAGAASKLLLAFLPADKQTAVLGNRLARMTPQTIVEPARLAASLAVIRANGYAEDNGEFVEGVRAIAAPVHDHLGACIAAVSVPFIGSVNAARAKAIRLAVIEAGREISAA